MKKQILSSLLVLGMIASNTPNVMAKTIKSRAGISRL